MVSQKYRWDFIGLSTDTKPTSETSDKVVNGSTFYCSDTSKLYVYCDGTWYERKALGGGGGGGTSDYPDLTNKPKINNVELNGNKTSSDLGLQPEISVVQTSASTIEIKPNTFYKFGEVASLNITLASITDNTIYNEYMFEFVSGTTATTLTLPSSIKWLETPTIDANKIYQCSIVDNIGILVGVANV